MTKVLFTDTHFGTHQNSMSWLNSQLEFIYNQFIPYVKTINDDIRVIHLGDVFDSRSTISTMVATRLLEAFNEIRKYVADFIIIGGNHDYYSPTTDNVDTLNLIFQDSLIRLVTNDIYVDGEDAYVPWYEWLNQDKLKSFIKGHQEIKNIYTHADIINEHVDSFFNDINIYSGHIHTPDIQTHRFNLGSCYSLTFTDANSDRGFYVDCGDGLKFHPNTQSIRFWRLYNDDIFDKNKLSKLQANDYIEIYINQTNLIIDKYTKQLDEFAKRFKNKWIIPQIVSSQIDESIDTFEGYNIEEICRKYIPQEISDKFERIVEACSVSKNE